VETYGADTATSKGQSVDPGATLNTKGAYTQLTAASASAADYLVPVANPQVAQTTKTAVYMWLDISTGAAASEVVKLDNAEIYEGIEEMDFNLAGAREVDIASGVRVAARAQSQNNTSGRREVDVAVVAFVKSAAPPASGAGTGRIIP
jgi:hypothetical protein